MDAAVDIRPVSSAVGSSSEAGPVRAAVNGRGPFDLRWRQVGRIHVPSGTVTLVVWSSRPLEEYSCVSRAELDIRPGTVVGLQWRMPGSAWRSGNFEVELLDPPTYEPPTVKGIVPSRLGKPQMTGSLDGRPIDEVPLGSWQPDPTGRFVHRWWDGAVWTDLVWDGTSTSSDPLPSK
jgi:hypothetical protein